MMSVIYAECRLCWVSKTNPYAYSHYAYSHYAECHYAECHYAECHYAECHYAECRGAVTNVLAYNIAVLITP